MSEEETNAVRLQCGTSAEPHLCLYLVHYVLVSMRSLPNAFNICQGLLFFKKCKYLLLNALGMHLKMARFMHKHPEISVHNGE